MAYGNLDNQQHHSDGVMDGLGQESLMIEAMGIRFGIKKWPGRPSHKISFSFPAFMPFESA